MRSAPGLLFAAVFTAAASLARAEDAGGSPRVAAFLKELGAQAEESKARFAKAAAADQAEAQWRALDVLLEGDKRDEDRTHIRRELKKLPPEQWHFVIRLDRERRAIHEELSGFLGLGNGPLGNAAENLGLSGKGHLCYERENALLERVQDALSAPQFAGWKASKLTANPGVKPPTLAGHAEHHAPCFFFEAPAGLVEISADAWDGALVPAYTWWWQWDEEMHDALHKEKSDWCGQTYSRVSQARGEARREAAARRERENRKRDQELGDFQNKLLRSGLGF